MQATASVNQEMQGGQDGNAAASVFEAPQGLPPARDHDHFIHLEPQAKPVNVRPYRYPYFQKTEVERQVQYMLEHQLIRRSTSPFSSPVLLVKKKDGTWRFCVDYRALNAVTIRDKFPIPTTDELFDELGTSKFFSKLDLLAGYHQIRVCDVDVQKTAFRVQFEWTVEAQAAMDSLKQCLSSTPVLSLPDFTKPFQVETYAFGIGIGAVLTQACKPLAYFSQKLCSRMRHSSTYNREMYAITQAVAKWRQYLLGRKFIILTDQRSLRELTQQTIQTPEQQRWLAMLIGYDFEIHYRPDKLKNVAGALSREPQSTLMVVSRPLLGLVDAVRAASAHDDQIQQLRATLLTNAADYPHHEEQNSLILIRGRILVPNETTIQTLLLREFHCSVIGGHAGITRTFQRLAANFYWTGMRQEVRRFVSECQVCQRMKSDSLTPVGLLQPLPIPSQVFADIAIDFIVGLPKSNGKEAIFVVVDRLTKYAHFFGLPRHFDSILVARILVQEVINLHGISRSIVSDRDRIFFSDMWIELARLQGTELCFSSAYHPQTDGRLKP
ncbi:hypothetical protein GQ457_04G013100 [Hibiscus cannabinus]